MIDLGTINIWDSVNRSNSPQIPIAFVIGQTIGTLRSDFDGFLGFKFTVGDVPISVTHLGRYMHSGNQWTHSIKLVLSTGATTGNEMPSSSVFVSMSGATVGQYLYQTMSAPVTLSANTAYYCVSFESSSGDQWSDESMIITGSSPAGSVYPTGAPAVQNGAILTQSPWSLRVPWNISFTPVNFKYIYTYISNS